MATNLVSQIIATSRRRRSISPSPIVDRWWLVVALGSIVVGTTKPATEKATAPGWLAIPIVAGPK